MRTKSFAVFAALALTTAGSCGPGLEPPSANTSAPGNIPGVPDKGLDGQHGVPTGEASGAPAVGRGGAGGGQAAGSGAAGAPGDAGVDDDAGR